MKYINLLANPYELHTLFPTAKLIKYKKINQNFNYIQLESTNEIVEVNHYIENPYEKLKNLKNILNENSLYLNPTENLTIVCDRKLWQDLYLPLLKSYPKIFYELEKRYVEKNTTVFFNFAFLEAVDYEMYETYFLYDFKFKNIKITDYELFEGKTGFYYDSFYCLYHLIAESQMRDVLYPSLKHSISNYHYDFKKTFENFNINSRLEKPFIYSHFALKPRYHRVKFLIEANKHNILQFGINNINEKFFDEYSQMIKEGRIYTDNTTKHSKNHLKYFNKETYNQFIKLKNKITLTKDEPSILYDHLRNYFIDNEWDTSYIEIVGETHCIFDLKYGFFTEKSIKPILSEKFSMIYGSNKIYSECKKLGIDLFVDDFGLNGIENADELIQIDMIINCLKNTNAEFLQDLYIKKYNTIKKNKEIMINHFCKIMNNINVLLLENKKNKLI
jgi:hypothetical protein